MSEFFTDEQLRLLGAKLDAEDIKTRLGADRKTLSYVEGWYIIDEANRVFGFGHWDCQTLEMKREHEPVLVDPSDPDSPAYEEDPKKRRKPFVVVQYSARVRVTVWSQIEGVTRPLIREGTGGHRGFATTIGEAIENTMKAAETDAMKRAFAPFGHRFGLALRDKSHKNVGRDEEARQIAQGRDKAMAPIDEGFEPQDDEQRQPISRRALEASRQPPAQAMPARNGHARARLPY